MFEYHAWTIAEPPGGLEAEDALADALQARIAELEEAARESFHVTRLNALTVTASGLRNRSQRGVLAVFEWLARECPQAYGLIYHRGEDPGEDGAYRFQVRRIHRGAIEHLEDRYFDDVP
ncbi:MAG TPA: Imm7 family immunity protein [Longimicrobium sp.]